MNNASLFNQAVSLADRFRRANAGNVAVIFAFAILPIIGFIGAAIDYSRVNNARTAMQTALDSAALMISKDATSLTAAQITSKAQAYFNALYVHPEVSGINVTAAYTPNSGSGASIVMTGSATMPTTFLKVAGYPQIDFSVGSTTNWGSTKMRVALALDNTGSMASDGKIGALQTAATNLINQLSATAATDGDVLISIIPFAKDVNVSAANYNASWLTGWTGTQTQPSAWDAEPVAIATSKPSGWSSVGPGSNCPFKSSTNGFVCDTDPDNRSPTTTTKIPSSGTYKGYICPGDDSNYFVYYNGCYNSVSSGSSYTHTWVKNATTTWNGCVTDRTQPYDTQNTAPTTTATSFFVEQYDACPSALMPLSSNWTGLKAKISAMSPAGGTNQPIGMAWAWHSLSQSLPLSAPAEDPKYIYSRAIILLSDGLNTQDRWPNYGNGNTQNTCSGNVGCIDARQMLLCDNIKSIIDPQTNTPAYTIYTIQVNTGSPADPTSSVLQYCASDSSKFTQVKTANQIISTFDSIGSSLSKLRVAK